jgi:hypothetical protein
MAILKNVIISHTRLNQPDFYNRPTGRWYIKLITKDLRQAALWKSVGIPTQLTGGWFQAIVTRRATRLDGSDEDPVNVIGADGKPMSNRLWIPANSLADVEYFSKLNVRDRKIAVLTGIRLI